tara:strand:+ start:238 stop:675 length:438 start_codon:yes stop_codon:yes gene_type:complete
LKENSMGKQVKIFDLLAKKQSLTVFKSQKRKNQLMEELNQVSSYKKQLLEISSSIETKQPYKTVAEIKSENWYNLKIQDELRAIDNKIEFLNLEIKNQNIQVATASEKQKKFQEKRKFFNSLEKQEKETRLESSIPSATNNRSKT